MQALFSKRVLVSLAVAVVVTGSTAVVGALVRDDASSAASAHPVQTPKSTTTTSTSTTTTTTAPPPPPDAHALVQPGPATLPAPPGGSVGSGSSGPEVQAYEQRLSDLHFDPGPIDGVYDGATVYAVQALQKVNGAVPTGRITDGDVFALSFFRYPTPLAATDAEPNRTEIDITKQVLTVYENYQVELISTTSTGSGENYCYSSPRVRPARACARTPITPAGKFAFYEFRPGWDTSPLGQPLQPLLLQRRHRGARLEDVPTYPASHGCARIPMHIAEYFPTLVTNGEPVYVVRRARRPSSRAAAAAAHVATRRPPLHR